MAKIGVQKVAKILTLTVPPLVFRESGSKGGQSWVKNSPPQANFLEPKIVILQGKMTQNRVGVSRRI